VPTLLTALVPSGIGPLRSQNKWEKVPLTRKEGAEGIAPGPEPTLATATYHDSLFNFAFCIVVALVTDVLALELFNAPSTVFFGTTADITAFFVFFLCHICAPLVVSKSVAVPTQGNIECYDGPNYVLIKFTLATATTDYVSPDDSSSSHFFSSIRSRKTRTSPTSRPRKKCVLG